MPCCLRPKPLTDDSDSGIETEGVQDVFRRDKTGNWEHSNILNRPLTLEQGGRELERGCHSVGRDLRIAEKSCSTYGPRESGRDEMTRFWRDWNGLMSDRGDVDGSPTS